MRLHQGHVAGSLPTQAAYRRHMRLFCAQHHRMDHAAHAKLTTWSLWLSQTHYPLNAYPKRRAAEQGAGADRLQRGGTWAIFMLRVLSLLVPSSVAAAQLERSVALHNRIAIRAVDNYYLMDTHCVLSHNVLHQT